MISDAITKIPWIPLLLLLSNGCLATGQVAPDHPEPFPFDEHDFGTVPYDDLDKSLDKEIVEATSSRRYVISMVYFVIAVGGAVMNVAAIVTSQRCSSLQYSQRMLMQNLCISSLLLILSMGFSAQYRLLGSWHLGSVMCKLVNCVKALAVFAQAFFVASVCVDYVILRKRPRIGDVLRTVLEIAAVVSGWVISLAVASPMLVFSEVEDLGKMKRCELLFQPPPPALYSHPDPQDEEVEYEDIFYEDYPLPEEQIEEEDVQAQNPTLECKDAENEAYKIWILISFTMSYILPLLVILIFWLLHRLLETPHSFLPNHSAFTEPTAARHRSRAAKNQSRPCMPAGTWVALICAVYFTCYAPFYAYHVGRIPGLPLGVRGCANLRDYSFVQGYFTCVLLPALVIAYSRPIGLQSCSRALTTSSMTSFGSSSSSKRKSTSSGESQTPDGAESGQLLDGGKPQQSSVL